ncbi:MAG: alpha/beta hydrolase [Lewinella sp.]|nr:alpha/beta hydrolase [Lewinella sp.]
MRFFLFCSLLALSLAACQHDGPAHHQSAARKGTVVRIDSFPSAYLPARNLDIYLPPGFDAADTSMRYPVLYMHDGQNLFDTTTAYGGVEWQVDEVLERLVDADSVRSCIVVGIWNIGDRRMAEYMPQGAFNHLADSLQRLFMQTAQNPALSDSYLRFLTSELKPYIDSLYPTLPDREDTFIAGSSMGGLISLYAITRYPRIFGGAACLSTHWPITLDGSRPYIGDTVVAYFRERLPDPSDHRLYFDFGTETLDQYYEPFQRQMDEALRQAGYTEGENWLTRKFEGHEHNEAYWARRLHEPLHFLLAK